MTTPAELQASPAGGTPPAIDLLSDTVTLPPPAMVEAMARAQVGDDVYGEDPTVNRLEAQAAAMLGMEAAILVASGTMANLLALLAHCPRGRMVLVGDQSDAFRFEAGGAAVLGGLVYQPLPTQPNGELAIADMERALWQSDDPQRAEGGVICLENTHCSCGGTVLSRGYLASVQELAVERGLPVHLDGARLFNAVVASGLPAHEIACFADSVSFCLSKGLAAPIGSLVAGGRQFIARVRRLRKMVGGGMRQAGFIAAAGIYALDHMIDRLAEDHEHARLLARGLAAVPGIVVDTPQPATNLVFFRLADANASVACFLGELGRRGVRMGELAPGRIRAVTHHGIRRSDVEKAVLAVREALAAATADGDGASVPAAGAAAAPLRGAART